MDIYGKPVFGEAGEQDVKDEDGLGKGRGKAEEDEEEREEKQWREKRESGK